VHGSVILYPADAPSTAYLVGEMANTAGIVYLRATRGAYPVVYPPEERFPIGGSKTHRAGPDDQVTLIGAGVTLRECLIAADQLAGDGIAARVVDLYSIKPIDRAGLIDAARVTHGRLVVAEDHYPEGGIGEAVLAALADTPHPTCTWPIWPCRGCPPPAPPPSYSTRPGSRRPTSPPPPTASPAHDRRCATSAHQGRGHPRPGTARPRE